ncbi:hypothetical protein SAMN05216598_1563 [Pseudomonas asplenii]|uniref:Uncharacterized protein n=1 Tax=Pseudomonas asplenii TaxID=53407 RepID=A0A1H1S593_9PSED|nr:hypothetical protein SAMN05216598_1563 [Pseudomonas asplenii]
MTPTMPDASDTSYSPPQDAENTDKIFQSHAVTSIHVIRYPKISRAISL